MGRNYCVDRSKQRLTINAERCYQPATVIRGGFFIEGVNKMADLDYGTVEGFQAYWQARGKEIPGTWDNDTIKAALLVSSEWIDAAFLMQFGGLKVGNRDQVREWPRFDVQDIYGYSVPSDSIPRELSNAVYEAMFRQLTTPGIFFKDYTPGKYTSATVFGAVSVQYAVGDAYSFQTQMPVIAALLRPILSHTAQGSYSSLSGGTGRG